MTKIFMFPGQGSQKVGMSDGIFERYPQQVSIASGILGYDLNELCSHDPKKQINQTQFTQPALYVVNALSSLDESTPAVAIGHSLGEYNALLQAGIFDFETGLRLVKKRGELMSEVSGGGMAAILGLDVETIQKIIADLGHSNIEVANYNSPSQTVISGIKEDIIAVQETFEKAGARRVVILPTSGAFHSKQMKSTQEKFAYFLEQFTFQEPSIPVIANFNAKPYGTEIKKTLTCQISSSVRWVDSMNLLLSKYPDGEFLELGPGKVLTSLLKQIKKRQ